MEKQRSLWDHFRQYWPPVPECPLKDDHYWCEYVEMVGREEAALHKDEYLRLKNQTVAS